MPDKTKGQGFSKLITSKLADGTLEILLQVEISEKGNTTVTVFKGFKKEEPPVENEGDVLNAKKSTPAPPEDKKPPKGV